jgi:hypothetical protein
MQQRHDYVLRHERINLNVVNGLGQEPNNAEANYGWGIDQIAKRLDNELGNYPIITEA